MMAAVEQHDELEARRSARRAHQRRVTALLEEIEERRRRLAALAAAGARPAGLRDLKAELTAARRELAAAVDPTAAAA
jgi:hypothetical protein